MPPRPIRATTLATLRRRPWVLWLPATVLVVAFSAKSYADGLNDRLVAAAHTEEIRRCEEAILARNDLRTAMPALVGKGVGRGVNKVVERTQDPETVVELAALGEAIAAELGPELLADLDAQYPAGPPCSKRLRLDPVAVLDQAGEVPVTVTSTPTTGG